MNEGADPARRHYARWPGSDNARAGGTAGSRAYLMAGLIAAELIGLALAYQVFSQFECRLTESELSCQLLRSLVARAIVVVVAFGVYIWARPLNWTSAQDGARAPAGSGVSPSQAAQHAHPEPGLARGTPGRWMALHLSGMLLLLAPLAAGPASAMDSDMFFGRALPFWILGAALAAVGALSWTAAPSVWKRWLTAESYSPVAIVGLAALAPDLARLLLPLWDWNGLATVTFAAVSFVLKTAGTGAYADPGSYIIGLDGFHVQVGRPCAGIEGFVLITGFVVLYAHLFRRDLRFPHYWLIVLPLGLAMSWLLNVVRIATLLFIGARISPEIAVNGFHSYAGWMFFALLALALVAVVHAMPLLRLAQVPIAEPRLAEDWLAACILPFTVFLVTGTIGSALTLHPDFAFPFRALALVPALALFWRHYRTITWSADPIALAAGMSVGLVWIAVPRADSATEGLLLNALSDLSGPMLAAWIVVRVIGTAILVPFVEELFFRGYLLKRLDFGGRCGQVFAVGLSSAAFAALHGRWLEAWVAGTVFAVIMLRRNRLGDAITAHVAANGLIALWAVGTRNWTAI